MGITRVIGRITNNSSNNYEVAVFNLNIFDKAGDFFDVIQFVVNGFKSGQTKSFEAIGDNELPRGCTFDVELDAGM